MPHRQPAVQSFQDLHHRPGIAGVFRPWQQLQGMQLEPHRVVPSHPPAVLEAQDLFQAQPCLCSVAISLPVPPKLIKMVRKSLCAGMEA